MKGTRLHADFYCIDKASVSVELQALGLARRKVVVRRLILMYSAICVLLLVLVFQLFWNYSYVTVNGKVHSETVPVRVHSAGKISQISVKSDELVHRGNQLVELRRASAFKNQREIVRAPFDGLVTEILEPRGSTIASGETEITLAKSGSQYIVADLDLAQRRLIHIGTRADILIGTDPSISARVTGISPIRVLKGADVQAEHNSETIPVQLQPAQRLSIDAELDGAPVKVRLHRIARYPWEQSRTDPVEQTQISHSK